MNKKFLPLLLSVILASSAYGEVINNGVRTNYNSNDEDVTLTNSILFGSTRMNSTEPSKLVIDKSTFMSENDITLIKGYDIDIKNSTFYSVLFGRVNGSFKDTVIFNAKLGETSDVTFDNSSVNSIEFFENSKIYANNTTFNEASISSDGVFYITGDKELSHGYMETYDSDFIVDAKKNMSISDIESEGSNLVFTSADDATITVGNILETNSVLQIGDANHTSTNVVTDTLDTDGKFTRLDFYTDIGNGKTSSLTVNNTREGSDRFRVKIYNNASAVNDPTYQGYILKLYNILIYPEITVMNQVESGGYTQSLYYVYKRYQSEITYYLANASQVRAYVDSLEEGDEFGLTEGQDPNAPTITTTADASGNVILTSYLTNFSEIQSIGDRLKDVNDENVGVWGRIYNGKFDSLGGGNLSGLNLKYTGIQLGVDKQVELTSQSNLVHGFGVTYTSANASYDRGGNGDAKSYSIAYYLSYFNEDIFYNDTIFKYSRMVNKFQVTDTAGQSVNGKGNMNVYTFSNELGKKFYFNEDKTGLSMNPFGQIILSKFGSSTIDASNGLTTKIASRQSVIGKVGSYVGYDFNNSKVYAKVAYGKEFNKDNEFTLNGSSETYQMDGGFMEYQLGTSLNITDSQKIDLTASYLNGDNFNQKQLGVTYRLAF